MLRALTQVTELAVDCEGINLGREGKLCLLALCASTEAPGNFAPQPGKPLHSHSTFLVDISSLGSNAFSHSPRGLRSLKEVLECSKTAKLFYDVRGDAEALYHQHAVKLQGVHDVQLAEVAHRRYGLKVRVDFVVGLGRALESYLQPDMRKVWQATAVNKRLAHAKFDSDPQYWDRRPLTEEQVRYAADDVMYLRYLYRDLTANLTPTLLDKVKNFSATRVEESQAPGVPGAVRSGSDRSRAFAPVGL